jgi:hypothetical protein
VPFLVFLRGFEIVLGTAEISAGILPVAVEKQLVELIRQIVMMGNVAPRAPHRVELIDPPYQQRRGAAQPHQLMGVGHVIGDQQVEEVIEAAFLDR